MGEKRKITIILLRKHEETKWKNEMQVGEYY
jgi:hypothetical protein